MHARLLPHFTEILYQIREAFLEHFPSSWLLCLCTILCLQTPYPHPTYFVIFYTLIWLHVLWEESLSDSHPLYNFPPTTTKKWYKNFAVFPESWTVLGTRWIEVLLKNGLILILSSRKHLDTLDDTAKTENVTLVLMHTLWLLQASVEILSLIVAISFCVSFQQ